MLATILLLTNATKRKTNKDLENFRRIEYKKILTI